MAQLQYKTRGSGSPQGKPRVYFACHPEDFRGYFEQICEEILKISNCVVYYYEGDVEPDEDFYLNLSQMQLVVMPITSRLLYMPSRAMDAEFPYAVEHHIPVLPLMQEPNLERRFNEKCGDLQFLDKENSDPTAIPYEEKLKKYLESVLVGDELAQKVRAAFDAYIFLSYRKKDRKYAQELMKLIHRSDFCRDIAIWYDEFLTPGENFNGAIQAALEKSDLFALAVTPNLVNEVNYVMTTEYPMALETGKPVIAAELVETDKTALRENYASIPDCVDPRDQAVMDASLAAQLGRLAIRENDKDPQHNFFIGLAYLSGIDVEVNHERAVELITGAAESGLTEAMEKLVSMYETGEGVRRDYHEAINWCEKLTEHWRKRNMLERTNDSACAFAQCLYDLGHRQYQLGLLDQARESVEEYSKFCQAQQDTVYWQRRCGAALNILGRIYEARNELADAKAYYKAGIKLAGDLTRKENSNELLRDYVVALSCFGSICESEGKITEAEQCYQEALKITRERLPKDENAQKDYAVLLTRLGNLCKLDNRYSDAKIYFEESLKLDRALVETEHTEKSWRGLLVTLTNLGDIYRLEGKAADAKKYYVEGLDIAKALAGRRGLIESQEDLAFLLYRMGDIFSMEGRFPDAKKYFAESLKIRKQLVQTIGTPKAQSDYCSSLSKLGYVAEKEECFEEAKAFYGRSLALERELVKNQPTMMNRRDVSRLLEDLGNVCWQEKSFMEAKAYFEESLEIRKKLTQEYPTVLMQMDYSNGLNNLGLICMELGELASAREYFEESMKMDEMAEKDCRSFQYRRKRSISLENLGEVCRRDGDHARARNYFQESMMLRNELAQETGTVQAWQELDISLNNYGNACKAVGDIPGARASYEKSINIRQALAKALKTVSAYSELAGGYVNLAMVQKGKEQRETLNRSVALWTQLADICPNHPEFARKRDSLKKLLQ